MVNTTALYAEGLGSYDRELFRRRMVDAVATARSREEAKARMATAIEQDGVAVGRYRSAVEDWSPIRAAVLRSAGLGPRD